MGASSSTGKKTFKWRIDGFSALLDQGEGWSTSGGFMINGFKWYMSMNPMAKKSEEKESHVSLELELARSSAETDYVVEAAFNLLIYDRLYGKHTEKKVCHDFHAGSRGSGGACMVPLEMLKSSSSGLLVNDSCVFGVQFIRLERTRCKHAPSSTLLVQKNNFVSDAHTWTIENYGEIKTSWCYSDVFESGGYKWHIRLYPNGDEVSDFLSLYLNLDESNDLPRNTGVFIQMSLRIKNKTKGKDKEYTCRKQFGAKNSWGWQKFISLEDFKNPLNGFLVKNKCAIEASIAILGSSN